MSYLPQLIKEADHLFKKSITPKKSNNSTPPDVNASPGVVDKMRHT
jgi:hypothetical protein